MECLPCAQRVTMAAAAAAAAAEGITWSEISRAYNTTVLLSNGTTVNFARRERPKLLFDTDGVTPIMLTNGVRPFVGHSWTLAVPLDA